MLEHDRMAGNVPAWIKTHTAFAVGQHFDTFGIKRVKTGVGQDVPVGREEIVEPVILTLAVKGAGAAPTSGVAKECAGSVAEARNELRRDRQSANGRSGCPPVIPSPAPWTFPDPSFVPHQAAPPGGPSVCSAIQRSGMRRCRCSIVRSRVRPHHGLPYHRTASMRNTDRTRTGTTGWLHARRKL
jgi:hypothetical protein